jgi:phospholipase C
MDGFFAAYRVGRGLGGPNPLGYYDARDLPYAWNLAGRYVLFDRFFSSAHGGSVWNHLFAISVAEAGKKIEQSL